MLVYTDPKTERMARISIRIMSIIPLLLLTKGSMQCVM